MKQKLLFKDAIELFHNVPSPEMQEKASQPIVYPNMAQVPTSPPTP
jgi:hypothetical protein